MAEGDAKARLFVALDLPDSIREGIAAWQAREAPATPGLRPVAPEALHITLAFLGYLPEASIDEVAGAALPTGQPAPLIRLVREPVQVPKRGPARLFALDAPGEGVAELQAGVSSRLAGAGLYEPESRPFWSHVTVFRVRGAGRRGRPPARAVAPPGPLPEPLVKPFHAVRTTVYRSKLRSTGAEYTPMAQVELAPS